MHLPRTLALLLPLVVAAGCGTATPASTPDPVAASSPTSGNDDLEDLPLLAGWPSQDEIGSDGTVTGPTRGMDPIVFTACGRTVRVDVADRVDARISWIEDFRQRAVGRYADESAATAAADEVVSLFDRCPTEPQDALTEVHRVTGDPEAEGGAVVTTSFRYDGADAIGVEGVVLLQRRDTLVVSTMSTEGMGQERARELAEEQARQLRPVLAELDRG